MQEIYPVQVLRNGLSLVLRHLRRQGMQTQDVAMSVPWNLGRQNACLLWVRKIVAPIETKVESNFSILSES